MKVIKEKIGDADILIAVSDTAIEVLNENIDANGRNTLPTSIESSDVSDAYMKLKDTIRNIAKDFGENITNFESVHKPKEIGLEFNMVLSATAGPMWIISATGEVGIKVSIKWELGDDGTRKQ